MLGTPRYNSGDFIKFYYTHAGFKRTRRSQIGDLHPAEKEVFVLHPLWNGKLHGIDLSRVTPAERDVLKQIMDPKVKSGETPARYPLVSDILNRFDPVELVSQPMTFYSRMVKPFLANKTDAYRTYFPTMMGGITVLEESSAGPPINVKPLFHKL